MPTPLDFAVPVIIIIEAMNPILCPASLPSPSSPRGDLTIIVGQVISPILCQTSLRVTTIVSSIWLVYSRYQGSEFYTLFGWNELPKQLNAESSTVHDKKTKSAYLVRALKLSQLTTIQNCWLCVQNNKVQCAFGKYSKIVYKTST